MNKNTLIGILLMAAILIGFSIYQSSEQKKIQEAKQKELIEQQRVQREQDSIRRATQQDTAAVLTSLSSNVVSPTEPAIDAASGNVLTQAAGGQQEFVTLENNLLSFSNKGGRIYATRLKNFHTYDSLPIVLFNGDDNIFSLDIFTNRVISTASFYFTPIEVPAVTMLNETDSVATLVYRLQVEEDAYIDYIYTLRNNSYMVDLSMSVNGMDRYIQQNVTRVNLNWSTTLLRQEKNFKSEADYSTVAYKAGNVDELSERKDAADDKITSSLQWIAFKQQFFSSILVAAGEHFESAAVAYKNSTPENINRELMRCDAAIQVPYKSAPETVIPLRFYFGPNHYKTLQSYDYDFEELVPLGDWIRPINRWLIIPVFDFLNKYIANYGIIILLLTLFIKLILSPFSQKSVMSSVKMKLLKPELDKLNEKYPKQEDAMKKQQEIMALYKKSGVSMMGGCLPMLLQMPILFAMFRFFPASFELRQEGFLWADDLSTYDSILDLPFSIPLYGDHVSLFALLMAVSTFFYSRTMMAQTPQTGQPSMKFMQLYFMPLFLLVLCNNFSSGLSYYYMLSNLITMLQTWVIRRFFVDEEKMRKCAISLKGIECKREELR